MYLVLCPVCASFVSYQADCCRACGQSIQHACAERRSHRLQLAMLAVGIALLVVPGAMLVRDWERFSSGKWLSAGSEAGLKKQPPTKGQHPARP
jgi:hypothetical protein